MVGIFRAWKVNGDEGVDREAREAVKRDCQTGSRSAAGAVEVDGPGVKPSTDGWGRASFAAAILFNKDAR